MVPQVRAALAKKPSLETTRRLEAILQKADASEWLSRPPLRSKVVPSATRERIAGEAMNHCFRKLAIMGTLLLAAPLIGRSPEPKSVPTVSLAPLPEAKTTPGARKWTASPAGLSSPPRSRTASRSAPSSKSATIPSKRATPATSSTRFTRSFAPCGSLVRMASLCRKTVPMA